MGIEEITSAITTLGFPIICVIACAYFINYIIKSEREENQKREEKYIENKLDEVCSDKEK